MDHRLAPRPRIAVVSAQDAAWVAQLSATAHRPMVERFRSLYVDADAIHRCAPAALFIEEPGLSEEDTGALRILRGLMPGLSVVLVSAQAAEVAVRATAERIGATVLVTPCSPRELSGVLDTCLAATQASAESLLDLARGICDEINNPLMFIDGHLQLLERSLGPDSEHTQQVGMIRDGLARIAATMDKVRMLARADETVAAREPVDLGALCHDAASRHARVEAGGEGGEVSGNATLLAALVEQLCLVAEGLPGDGCAGRLRVQPGDGRVELRAVLDARQLPGWQLPRTFEPYYLNRVLRGTQHGLGLFLVQVLAHVHGGSAVARWDGEGELAVEVRLPR